MNKNQTLQLLSNLSIKQEKTPIIIEFSGTPNSGKTSLIDEINTIFGRYKIKSKTICESAKHCLRNNSKNSCFN